MIKSLPQIYPNELFSSYLARLYSHSGHIYHVGLTSEIFQRPSEYVSYNFVNILKKDFLEVLNQYVSMKQIIFKHTLFPYYVRFVSKEKRQLAMEVALSNQKCLSHRQLPIPSNKKYYYLRYCPICIEEDRKKYGECYFHVEHQIPELSCCPHHGVQLISTKKDNSQSHDSTLWPLEELVDSVEVNKANEIDEIIAKYIYNSLKEDVDFNNDNPIGSYLVERLNDKYFSPRGEQKDLDGLLKDLREFYRDFSEFNVTKGRLATIYRNEYINVFDIYLIALFEGITVKELCAFKQAKKTRYELFDDKVRELKKAGKTQAQIASILKVNHEVVRQVLLGTYDKEKSKTVRFKCKRWNWEKLDARYCDKFNNIKHTLDRSMVKKSTVAKLLGINDFSLRNLPKLKNCIRAYKIESK